MRVVRMRIPLALAWLAVATFVLVSVTVIDEASADPAPLVDRPDDLGPIPVGHIDVTYRFTTKSYDTRLRIYYPAMAAGAGTDPDPAGAPYMCVVWMPFFGGGYDMLDFQGEYLASYGAVVVAFGVNWDDFPRSGSAADIEELLDHLEDLNATSGNRLYGMVDAGAFGICGHSSGGGFSLVDGAQVDRLRAVQAWAPAIGSTTVDTIAPMLSGKPVLVQVGKMDATYIDGSRRTFEKVGPPITLVEIHDAGHSGPFEMDTYVSFFLENLANKGEFGTFVHGDEALGDVAGGRSEVFFKMGGNYFFPPKLVVTVSRRYAGMDENVTFKANITGYRRWNDPEETLSWDLRGPEQDETLVGIGTEAKHSFTSPGDHQVRFNYSLGVYRLLSDPRTVSVSNVPPVAKAGPDAEVDHDGWLQLDGSASTDTVSDRDHLLYQWTFSDGFGTNTTAHNTVMRQFNSVGELTAVLTVIDPHGARTSDSLVVTVVNVPPTASTVAMMSADEDEPIRFGGSGDDTISHRGDLTFMWDFGDGITAGWSRDPGVSHAYTRSGIYTAVLSVRDPEGDVGTATVTVEVSNVDPAATILSPSNGDQFVKEAPVEFRAKGTDTPSDEVGLEFKWDFGDGSISQWLGRRDTDVFYTYSHGGTYQVVLRVRDGDGAETTTKITLQVINQPPEAIVLRPDASITVDEDQDVTFTGSGSDTPGDLQGLTYRWDIDGTTYQGRERVHVFTTAGTYTAELVVTDPDGAEGRRTVNIIVVNVAPEVTLLVQPREVLTGENVTFGTTVVDTPSDMASLRTTLTMGDGTTLNVLNGTHSFSAPGTYFVNVTVEDDDGATATASIPVTVTAPPQPPGPPDDGGTGDGGGSDGISATMAAAIAVVALGAVVVLLTIWRGTSRGDDEEAERP